MTAVEPSAVMIAQRPPDAAPAVQASAEALPFEDASFDAAMAVLTMHHWSDWRAGIEELRRVARAGRPVLVGPELRAPPVDQREYFPVSRTRRRDFPASPTRRARCARRA